MPGFVFFFVKNTDVFLAAVEMKPANRLAIIIVKQNPEVAL